MDFYNNFNIIKKLKISKDVLDFVKRSEAARQPLASQVDDAASSIRSLQRMEAERLQLVAAHHAEQSRELLAKGDERCLLDVRRRLGEASSEISELISELRYAAADLRP